VSRGRTRVSDSEAIWVNDEGNEKAPRRRQALVLVSKEFKSVFSADHSGHGDAAASADCRDAVLLVSLLQRMI